VRNIEIFFRGRRTTLKMDLSDSVIKLWTPFYFGDMNMLGRSVHWCNLQGHSPERIASGQIGANVAGCVALFFSSPPLLFLLLPHSLGFCWTQKFFFRGLLVASLCSYSTYPYPRIGTSLVRGPMLCRRPDFPQIRWNKRPIFF
jgi:hypothetical protein